jgi:hypothetical protein
MKRISQIVVLCLVASILIVPFLLPFSQPSKTQQKQPVVKSYFVISDLWNASSNELSGLDMIRFYENSTGSWVAKPFYTHYYPDYHEEALPFYSLLNTSRPLPLTLYNNASLKIRLWTWLNITYLGVSLAEGAVLLRQSIDVYAASTLVFSQQNGTLYDSTDYSPYYARYEFDFILNFVQVEGTLYTAIITCEAYW